MRTCNDALLDGLIAESSLFKIVAVAARAAGLLVFAHAVRSVLIGVVLVLWQSA